MIGKEGWVASLNSYAVSGGSAVDDVFPCLHVLITCVVLDFERRTVPQRFWVMLPVALFLFASTVYLRYHYAIDLVAGFVCFGLLLVWFQNWDGENR